MTTVADVYDVVIGVDTHLRTHTLARAGTGRAGGYLTVANSPTGWGQALAFVTAMPDGGTSGDRVVVAMEGTRSHGAQLARFLVAAGVLVVEIERPRRRHARQRGKSDLLDARAAARAVLDYDADRLPTPRADGAREALRILLGARDLLVHEATATWNALLALLATGDPADLQWRRELTRSRQRTLRALAIRPAPAAEPVDDRVRREQAAAYAARLLALAGETRRNERALRDLLNTCAPALLDLPGVGPVTAARATVAWSHPGRCHDADAFARLAGAAPLEASTGEGTGPERGPVRHRLSRGGDRRLNSALHMIILTRARNHEPTRAYIARRTREGKTRREIRRCLKTYLARQLYRTLTACWQDTTTPLAPTPASRRGAPAVSSSSPA
jgi:transposase